jgi:hypothetical protein
MLLAQKIWTRWIGRSAKRQFSSNRCQLITASPPNIIDALIAIPVKENAE